MDNPSAFPHQPLGSDGLPEVNAHEGMTLRDWFAGQALSGLLASTVRTLSGHANIDGAGLVKDCYVLADAMLAARTNGGQSNG